jgi:hypothetical protein
MVNVIKSDDLINVNDKVKGAKAINREAQSIAASASKLGRRLHIVLLSAVSHAMAHGDCRIIDQVFATVDQAMARGKIVTWIEGLSNLKKGKDKDENVTFRKPKDGELTVRIDEMMAVSPWEFSVDPQEKEFDFEAKLAALLSTASKKIKKGDKIKRGAEALSPKLLAIAEFVKQHGVNVTVN